ncbi:MAG: hypothetical protein GX359_07265 [Clostridiales bacterium]|nr:hypothetical protein [Clostridiales bacterium]
MKHLKKVLIVSAFLLLLNVLAPAAKGYVGNPGGGYTPQSDLPYAD